MYFPITDVTISPLFLAGVGFMVGLLGGFFGVGGGFLAGPMMFLAGVPMNFVVGTDLAHMTGKSIVAARRHRVLGHVDIKLGLLMVLGTVPGVEVGALLIEGLEVSGNIDMVVGLAYVLDLIPPERTAEFMGFSIISVALAQIFGPVLGGLLIDTLGYRSIFPAAAAFMIIGLILLQFVRPRRDSHPPATD